GVSSTSTAHLPYPPAASEIMDLLEGKLLYTVHGHQVMIWKSNFDRTAFADVRVDRNTTPGLQGVSSTSTAHLPYPPAASERKENLALLEQEQARARGEAMNQEKLREEEKIKEELEKSLKVCREDDIL
ncbi:hypothetical protein NHX12_025582, partial [Muraenolepis orangiensis]